MKSRSPSAESDHLPREIAALSALSVKHLKNRWRSLSGTEPPRRISRELLTRALAYRLQERAFGGLKPSTRRLLERIVEGRSSSHLMRVISYRKAAPGTVLIREWQGASHRVTVLDDGVIYRGRCYQSLSEVARVITGNRWSGPLFFGLKAPARWGGSLNSPSQPNRVRRSRCRCTMRLQRRNHDSQVVRVLGSPPVMGLTSMRWIHRGQEGNGNKTASARAV